MHTDSCPARVISLCCASFPCCASTGENGEPVCIQTHASNPHTPHWVCAVPAGCVARVEHLISCLIILLAMRRRMRQGSSQLGLDLKLCVGAACRPWRTLGVLSISLIVALPYFRVYCTLLPFASRFDSTAFVSLDAQRVMIQGSVCFGCRVWAHGQMWRRAEHTCAYERMCLLHHFLHVAVRLRSRHFRSCWADCWTHILDLPLFDIFLSFIRACKQTGSSDNDAANFVDILGEMQQNSKPPCIVAQLRTPG